MYILTFTIFHKLISLCYANNRVMIYGPRYIFKIHLWALHVKTKESRFRRNVALHHIALWQLIRMKLVGSIVSHAMLCFIHKKRFCFYRLHLHINHHENDMAVKLPIRLEQLWYISRVFQNTKHNGLYRPLNMTQHDHNSAELVAFYSKYNGLSIQNLLKVILLFYF